MQPLNKILKNIIIAAFITCGTAVTAYGQSVVDTSAKPQPFAPGIVTTPFTEWATSFTPDGKTVYFSRGAIYWTMCYSKQVEGKWTKPHVVNISGKWTDTDPFITPDGKKIFFISNRPIEGTPQDKHQLNYHIWYADHLSDDDWGAPHRLDTAINLKGVNNFGISVNRAGDLYFCSRDRGGHNGMSSYYAKWLGDHFDKPQLLALRGNEEIQDPFIAPDGSYLIFESGPDLYITYKKGDGWAEAEKLGANVNNGDYNSSPCISPDGKMLYYSSARLKGLFKPRDPKAQGLNYDELVEEMNSVFNGQDNILMIPINIPKLAR